MWRSNAGTLCLQFGDPTIDSADEFADGVHEAIESVGVD